MKKQKQADLEAEKAAIKKFYEDATKAVAEAKKYLATTDLAGMERALAQSKADLAALPQGKSFDRQRQLLEEQIADQEKKIKEAKPQVAAAEALIKGWESQKGALEIAIRDLTAMLSAKLTPDTGPGRANAPQTRMTGLGTQSTTTNTYSPTYNYAPTYGKAPTSPVTDFIAMRGLAL